MIADLKRRVEILNIFPMKFNEFLFLKYGKLPPQKLADELLDIFFNSSNAAKLFSKIQKKEKEINRYFVNEIPKEALNNFFESGSFPFTLKIENKQKALEKLRSIIDSIIVKDILKLKGFETNTLAKVNDLLYLLAQSDVISYQKLQNALRI